MSLDLTAMDISCVPTNLHIGRPGWGGGALVSPRHLLLVRHFRPDVPQGGAPAEFLNRNGAMRLTRIRAYFDAPGADLCVALLDPPLPSRVTIAKVPLYRVSTGDGFFVDQDRRLRPAVIEARYQHAVCWTPAMRDKDSGSPVLARNRNGRLLVVSLGSHPNSGPNVYEQAEFIAKVVATT
jgi:hypothetical protein